MPSCIRASLHIDIYGLMTGNYSMRMEKMVCITENSCNFPFLWYDKQKYVMPQGMTIN